MLATMKNKMIHTKRRRCSQSRRVLYGVKRILPEGGFEKWWLARGGVIPAKGLGSGEQEQGRRCQKAQWAVGEKAAGRCGEEPVCSQPSKGNLWRILGGKRACLNQRWP